MNDISNLTPIYKLQNISKHYDGKCVLDIDQLSIFPGEIFALVGPSGSGKSTLLRLLNFLESPTTGNLVYKDNPIEPANEISIAQRRTVTTVFQRPVLLNLSVWENIRIGLLFHHSSEPAASIASALAQVGLVSLSKSQARNLSGGEIQRVALARAIVLHPDVLLLDEPTANLDPYNVGLIENIIRRLNQDQGMTIVLVTHNVFQAKRLAKRVGLILDGKLIEINNVRDFFEMPSDSRTAAFIRGDMVY